MQNEGVFVLLVCFGLYIDVLNISMRFSVIPVYRNILKHILWDCLAKVEMFDLLEICFLLFQVPIMGCYALYRIEETKLVCAVSRKTFLFGKHNNLA